MVGGGGGGGETMVVCTHCAQFIGRLMIQLRTKKKKKNGAESGIWLYSVSNVTDQSRVHCSDTHTHTYTKHKDHAYHMPLISMHPSKTARKGPSASTIPQMCPTPVAIHLTIISSPRFLIKKLAGAPQQVKKLTREIIY